MSAWNWWLWVCTGEHHSKSSFSLMEWWQKRAVTEFTNSSLRAESNISHSSNFVLASSSFLSFFMFNYRCQFMCIIPGISTLCASKSTGPSSSLYRLCDGNYTLKPRIFVWNWQTRFTLQKNRPWSEHSMEWWLFITDQSNFNLFWMPNYNQSWDNNVYKFVFHNFHVIFNFQITDNHNRDFLFQIYLLITTLHWIMSVGSCLFCCGLVFCLLCLFSLKIFFLF